MPGRSSTPPASNTTTGEDHRRTAVVDINTTNNVDYLAALAPVQMHDVVLLHRHIHALGMGRGRVNNAARPRRRLAK
jgi:hypothetical protein